jgi:nicotinate (nicotinamide) nucleotide adenylyltransferase
MEFIKKPFNLQALNFLSGTSLKIGLLGGSFDPAHEGHLEISLQALKYYHLDYVIWIVANQNPHKHKASKDIFARAQDAAKLINHPRIIISTLEHDLGCYYSYHVIKYFSTKFPRCNFTWLMGIDVFLTFHKWYHKKDIVNLCDIIVFDRPIYNRLVNIYSLGAINYPSALDKTKTSPIILYRGKLKNISSSFIRCNIKKYEFK